MMKIKIKDLLTPDEQKAFLKLCVLPVQSDLLDRAFMWCTVQDLIKVSDAMNLSQGDRTLDHEKNIIELIRRYRLLEEI